MTSPLLAPIPVAPSSTLAPPTLLTTRPTSSNSNRSSSSRRGRSGTSSSNVSRSNSHSSRASEGGQDKLKKSGATTTISGGVTLGVKEGVDNKKKPKAKKEEKVSNGNRRQSQAAKKPAPIITARPASANSDRKVDDGPQKSLVAPVSAPRTALEAAVDAATKKHQSLNGGDALASLNKMIADLKSISPVSGPSTARSSARDSSPSESKSAESGSMSSSAPKRLKADAPSFTPSFQPSISPVASQPAISPSTQPAWLPPQSISHGDVRRASAGSLGIPYPNVNPSPGSAYNSYYPNQLAVHQEAEREDLIPQGYGADVQYYEQLLAAQQLQYQQIQLLQAQIAANQLAQQQAQQQQQMGGFIAPRFQALAAQRAAAHQQQQAQQLAQAQQLFELQQQQLQHIQLDQDRQVFANPPTVFEEDSPEPPPPSSLGPTGRPQLAPSFTFGARRDEDRNSTSPPQPIINRSEGIGGAAATGLAGLAARAHKRTGSEMTTAMQQQLEIQNQIEALQAKQKALMAEDLASKGSGISQLNTLTHSRTPSQTLARHRRVQSSAPSANLDSTFNSLSLTDVSEPPKPSRSFGEMPPPPVPASAAAGHSRRHSVNVFNKTAGSGAGFSVSEIPEESAPSHHRSGSRSGFESGNWRITSQANNGVSDLALAQAQLQSLAQFRAAAGGGHAKMASFAFPNMLPNLLAATTLQAPPGQTLLQQQQSFQMQLQQTSQGPQRKSLFAPYLPQASLPPLLQAGKLVVGILRVNKKNRSDAYVATDVLDADIYICGSKDRNRALEGDIVAVELLDVDEVWGTKKDKEEKKRKKEENAAYDLKPATAKKLEKKKDDVEVEGQGLTLFDDEEVNDETKPAYAGHVVAVVERMPGQLFSGQLGVLRPSSAATKEKQELERRDREGDRARPHEPEARPKIVWFKPTDKRVPLIAIPTEQAPGDFVDNPDAYVDRLFVATIKRWPITSLHPFGTLVEELGPIGDCEVETSALLKDCNFPTEEFGEMALKCLPPLPWSIPDREYEVRTDLRNERVFTIDPPTARDLDDALSVKLNDDGTYTVGVHIADVSFFVKNNSALDREARKRATSVYLVQRAVPMLPPQLSEELCSLVPGVERLAFSAFFTLDEKANVVERKFAKTIIQSCAKLAYKDAQEVVNGGQLPSGKVSGQKSSEVEHDIGLLSTLAKKLLQKRTEAGAMVDSKVKVTFELNEEGRPIDCVSSQRTDANILVEEFMLLANTSVARFIANGLPEQSLLRRHEAPIDRRIEGFVKRAAKLGYEFDATDAKSLQTGFDAIKDDEVKRCLELLKRKAMQRAKYFCAGMLDIAKYGHWALSTPLYTHFTSPIRRYADVLVHRMLDACLASPNPNEVKFYMDRDQVAKCAQQCNMKKASAKLAEEQSVHLYLCMLVHDLTERYGPVIREGRVTSVLDAAFDVVIPEFGIEKRVHVDKMPVENAVHDEHRDILSLYWTTQDVLSYLAETTDEPHLLKIQELDEQRKGSSTEATARPDDTGVSTQYAKSAEGVKPTFDGLRTQGGHRVQDVREMMSVPVIVTADMTKSPPVLVVYACNPYAA
ncbi:hypothetical protein BCR39DRAFT_64105 [Naematelia encephala]|uniref:DIS3-like exonuclease 2 n=1 Tax=Naematelia encephala TaxID=71784 RepID=A0A1Y2AFP9_9TREE|nr:hypothetical protein BCR39DRAFT_64105 [Naematelia encephala]